MRFARLLLLITIAVGSCASDDGATESTATTVVAPPDIIGTAPPATEPTIPDWRGDVVNPLAVHLGECINTYAWTENDRRVRLTTEVDCATPHDQEVYFETNFPAEFGTPYPGVDFLTEYAQAACYKEFEVFVGTQYETSALELEFTIPPEDAYTDRDARYRGIVCYARRADGEQLVGTARGSGL